MSIKKTLNYSPNFNLKRRNIKQIKFIVFHYTGMKYEKSAINRLTNIQSEVSTHYLVKNNGEIILMVPEIFIAWHAGVSFWRNYKYINKFSIGIEISNPGHSYNYKKYSKRQIKSVVKLTKYLIKKYKIKKENILGHSDVAPKRKKDPGEKFPWKHLSKNKIGLWHDLNVKSLVSERLIKTNKFEKNKFVKNLYKIGYPKNIDPRINSNNFKKLVVAFQRRFRQDLINGTIDKECLLISENVVKKL